MRKTSVVEFRAMQKSASRVDLNKMLQNHLMCSSFFPRDVLEVKSEKTKIAWPKNARPEMPHTRDFQSYLD